MKPAPVGKPEYPLSKLCRFFLAGLSFIAPAIPVAACLRASLPSSRLIVYIIIWVIMGVFYGFLFSRDIRKDYTLGHLAIHASYSIATLIIVLLAAIWTFSRPQLELASLKIFAIAAILPIAFEIFSLCFKIPESKVGWRDAVLPPSISIVVTLFIAEFAAEKFLMKSSFGDNISVNSRDRSYWYIAKELDPSGKNLANSFGFIGPEPAADFRGVRVLVIGDSMPVIVPAAGDANFPKVAEQLYLQGGLKETGGKPFEIVNASMPSFSLEQIQKFYAERLSRLKHNIVVLSFYVDDINRELRFRKNNYLYTPSWPEWMQDVYYNCYFCRAILNLSGFSENTFLFYRRSSYDQNLNRTLEILNNIKKTAEKNRAKLALFNVPRMGWSGALSDPTKYQFANIDALVSTWCRDNNVPYHSALPALIGRDVRDFRISETDSHFTNEGHKIVGAELKRFLDFVLTVRDFDHQLDDVQTIWHH